MLGQLDRDQMIEVLKSQKIGRLGCYHDGVIYVVPLTFVYHEGSLYGHTTIGMKSEMVKQNPNVCFEVDDMIDMANWKSVISWGYFEILEGEEAFEAVKIFAKKMAPHMTSVTSQPAAHGFFNARGEMSDREFKGLIFKIRISKMTGRFEQR